MSTLKGLHTNNSYEVCLGPHLALHSFTFIILALFFLASSHLAAEQDKTQIHNVFGQLEQNKNNIDNITTVSYYQYSCQVFVPLIPFSDSLLRD
jgi:hypothetical protein